MPWLVKSDPETYSADDLERDGKTNWNGVRNPTARANLRAMKKGDLVFVYHSGDDKAVLGVAEVVKEGYPDDEDESWVQVDLKWKKRLRRPVTLAEIKQRLPQMELARLSRLSVSKVTDDEWAAILALAG